MPIPTSLITQMQYENLARTIGVDKVTNIQHLTDVDVEQVTLHAETKFLWVHNTSTRTVHVCAIRVDFIHEGKTKFAYVAPKYKVAITPHLFGYEQTLVMDYDEMTQDLKEIIKDG